MCHDSLWDYSWRMYLSTQTAPLHVSMSGVRNGLVIFLINIRFCSLHFNNTLYSRCLLEQRELIYNFCFSISAAMTFLLPSTALSSLIDQPRFPKAQPKILRPSPFLGSNARSKAHMPN